MISKDTICAMATSTAESAVGIIRVSGSLAATLSKNCFGKIPEARFASLGNYRNLAGDILDNALFIYFENPNSYTGEDSLEIFTHGNPFIMQNILEDLCARGCRYAQAGEFTRRAFQNGKMDLSQAEAVSLLINARNERALKASQRQLAGELGLRINSYSQDLISICALVEAYIDFPEEELPEENSLEILNSLKAFSENLNILITNSKYTNVIHQGINVAIVGEPNAGKSSLLNLLLDSNRAIVSEIAGTTRDFISEKIILGQYNLNLTDTAGIRSSENEIEVLGIKKSFEIIDNADLILIVIDSSCKSSILEELKNLDKSKCLVAFNKSDLIADEKTLSAFSDLESVRISCKNKKDAQLIKDKILNFISAKKIIPQTDDILVSARHCRSLVDARDAAIRAMGLVEENAPAELLASELHSALDSLGEIVGSIDNERILDKIFSSFCIGK